MNKILIVKSIFSPNDDIFTNTYLSLINLYKFNSFFKLDIILLGWITNSDNKTKIEKLIDGNKNINTIVDFWDINYGKYYLFNKINEYISNHKTKYDGILYFDHDIIVMSLDKMINISNKLLNHMLDNKNIGSIVYNQKGDSRHQLDIYEHKKCIDDEIILYSDKMNIMSIAMGCFFMSVECFMLCTPMENISVYGMDDYILCSNVIKNNFNIIVTLNISIYHPFHNDKKYIEWKNEMIKKIINKDIKYEESIIDSMLFFKNENN